MSKDEVLLAFNTQRKASKDKWVFFNGDINGKLIKIKSWNTWIQIVMVFDADATPTLAGGKHDSGPMDCSVKVMNTWLGNFLDGA